MIESNLYTCILTSASLVRDPDDETKMVANMKVGAPNVDVLLVFPA